LDGGGWLFYGEGQRPVNDAFAPEPPAAAAPRRATRDRGVGRDAGRDEWLDAAPVTRAIITLNVAVFLMEAAISRSFSDVSSRLALELGASYGLATVGEMRWETLVTACFLHAGLLHLGFNMVVLWLAGPVVERVLGSARMVVVYLVAGAAGNLLSVVFGWTQHSGGFTVGASGAISGVLAAALVAAWRLERWSGAHTQAVARWLGFVIVLGVLSNIDGSRVDNAAHLGGALAGAAAAALWRRTTRYSPVATGIVVGACTAVLVGCIGVVAFRDRTDPFATMMLRERSDFTSDALADGRCGDAQAGLAAVERLRAKMAPVTSLRNAVEGTCGHLAPR
jgi:rhomboid protease GluP